MLTVSGPPSSGKTSVIIKAAEVLQQRGYKIGVVKLDCLATHDDQIYKDKAIEVEVGLSEGLCPDHFFVSNIETCHQWASKKGFDIFICESAGLCNRCSPHIKGVLGVCVIDNLMGINAPKKIGPLLKFADIIVITKSDIVSQAEREVFAYKVKEVNPRCNLLHVNGITGQGAFKLAELFEASSDVLALDEKELRYTMPSALCSYCLGETKIGEKYQMGSKNQMDIR